jgi:hypothetical protein
MITQTEVAEIVNLYHTAKIVVSTRFDRLQWAAKEFCKLHPEVSHKEAYKLVEEETHPYK